MAARGGFHWMQECVVLLLCLSEAVPAASQTTGSTYYETLNVETTATDGQIKKAFRKLAIKYHPDKNKSVDAEKTFREITEAYKVLSNKGSRRLYDSLGHEDFLKNEASNDPEDEHQSSFTFSFSDLFQNFDDGPFMEDTHFQYSFPQDYEEDEDPHGHFSFEGFHFHFSDGDENEEEYY